MKRQTIEEKDNQNKQKYETYKKYQQKTVTPLKLSKQTHYNISKKIKKLQNSLRWHS